MGLNVELLHVPIPSIFSVQLCIESWEWAVPGDEARSRNAHNNLNYNIIYNVYECMYAA